MANESLRALDSAAKYSSYGTPFLNVIELLCLYLFLVSQP